jgi:hypothetical protein
MILPSRRLNTHMIDLTEYYPSIPSKEDQECDESRHIRNDDSANLPWDGDHNA